MERQQHFNSASVPLAQRNQYWSDVLCTVVGDIRIEPVGNDPLEGAIQISRLGPLRLSNVQLGQCRVLAPTSQARFRSGFEIMFQAEGRSHFKQGAFETEIGPGECLAFDNSLPYVIENAAGAVVHMIDIPYELATRKGVPYARLTGTTPSDASLVRVAYNALLGVERELKTLPQHMMVGVAAALTDLLLLPFTASRPPLDAPRKSDALLGQIKAYINDNLSDPMLSVARIAEAVGCTKRYLHMIFKAEQTTLSRYIWGLRLHKARDVIENAGTAPVSITDIAYSLGFSSSSHFCRLFKQAFGVPPSELKHSHRRAARSMAAPSSLQ